MRSSALMMCLVAAAGCGPVELGEDDPGDPNLTGSSGDVELADADEVASTEDALSHCFCRSPFACGHSSSPSFMFSAAHAALVRAGISDGLLIQTFGDAAASVGTHCPEPGTTKSAATDIVSGSAPCTRTRALRMQGFAAWYRVPPSFGRHIHAVYAGAPVLKSSLQSQVSSFLSGRNGLVSNAIDTVCPITTAEKNAVRAARDGTPPNGGGCVPGGYYCGTDKVSGDRNTLYKCNADQTATKVRACSHGCSINAGTDDSCRCVAGSNYCGGDVINGNSSTLYKCDSDGVGASVVRSCANGCAVVPGAEDHCK
ncbi:MAG: hypothetical protein IPJ65_24805 [Archangiaceae bacterium]|nr:hypothetical protein [Archangiaceae bacterium]